VLFHMDIVTEYANNGRSDTNCNGTSYFISYLHPPSSPSPSNMLLQVQRLHIAERLQSAQSPLVAEATLLVPAKRIVRIHFEMRVDPD